MNYADDDSSSNTRVSTTWNIPKTYNARQIVYAIRHAKTHPRDFYQVDEYDGKKMTAVAYVAWFRKCLHAKINRERRQYGRNDAGDYYMSDSERATMQLARRVNTPRLIVRMSEVPREFRERLAHRIWAKD